MSEIINPAIIKQAYCDQFNLEVDDFYNYSNPAAPSPFVVGHQKYKPVKPNLVYSIIRQDQTDKHAYIKEFYECDAYAFRLLGILHTNDKTAAMPIFLTWVLKNGPGTNHAVLTVYYKGKIWVIDAMRDAVYRVPNSWQLLLLAG